MGFLRGTILWQISPLEGISKIYLYLRVSAKEYLIFRCRQVFNKDVPIKEP